MACAGMDKVNEAQDMEYQVLYGLKTMSSWRLPLRTHARLSGRRYILAVDFFGSPKEDSIEKDMDMARSLLSKWHKDEIAIHGTNTDCMTPQRTMLYWHL